MERHFYHSDIMAYESAPMYINLSQLQSNEDDNVLPILFRLYKSIETMLISDVGVTHEETATDLEDKKLIRVARADTGTCSALVTEVLNDMDVPEDEQETILGKVLEAVPKDHHELENVHELPVIVIVVDIYDVTLQHHRIVKYIPANKFR